MVRAMTKALFRSILSAKAYERVRQIYWNLWDIWHGVETSGFADIQSLSVVGDNRTHAVNYEPSGKVGTILKELNIDFEQYGFVDLGSGKGRILLEAAAFPFISVEGVEFSSELQRIGEKNIQKYRRGKLRCRVINSILADATEFSLPAIPLVLYMFNPFTGPVLASVINNIQRSALAHPRDLLIISTGTLRPKDAFERIPNIQIVWRRKYSTVYRL